MHSPRIPVTAGDVIARPEGTGWRVIKILVVDDFSEDFATAHCLIFNDGPLKPALHLLPALGVWVWHAPISATSFGEEWTRIGNAPVTTEELSGFVEYLKLTDFPRFVAFTGQDSKEIVRRANEHYKRAFQLGDEGRLEEAIAEYSQAIDLFPLFHEAIDNRAFTYMDSGRYAEALNDFELSLSVNPGGMTAFFSQGECFLRLRQFDAAEAIFAEGTLRFPAKSADFEKYQAVTREMRRQASSPL